MRDSTLYNRRSPREEYSSDSRGRSIDKISHFRCATCDGIFRKKKGLERGTVIFADKPFRSVIKAKYSGGEHRNSNGILCNPIWKREREREEEMCTLEYGLAPFFLFPAFLFFSLVYTILTLPSWLVGINQGLANTGCLRSLITESQPICRQPPVTVVYIKRSLLPQHSRLFSFLARAFLSPAFSLLEVYRMYCIFEIS